MWATPDYKLLTDSQAKYMIDGQALLGATEYGC